MTKMYRFININKTEDNSEWVEISYGISNANEIIQELSQSYFEQIKNNEVEKTILAKYIGTHDIHDGKAWSILSNIDAKIYTAVKTTICI